LQIVIQKKTKKLKKYEWSLTYNENATVTNHQDQTMVIK